MERSARDRYRDRSRDGRSRSRDSGSNVSITPRDRDRSATQRERSSRCREITRSPPSRSQRHRDGSRNRRDSRDEVLGRIMTRLDAIEDRFRPSLVSTDAPSQPEIERHALPPLIQPLLSSTPVSQQTTGLTEEISNASNVEGETNKLVGVLSKLIYSKPQHFYISTFDPSVHDFDTWCEEVDRGRLINKWDERECLGRIGSCLRGDAKTWLNEWVTNDRTWSNFKVEFRALCPREIDVATVLFEVMNKSSSQFPTYAEYARKSLLRLNIVKGLSDELRSAIVVRGIADPQVKAAATNAKLAPKDLVEFLSIYVKSKSDMRPTHSINRTPVQRFQKRGHSNVSTKKVTCYHCGKEGHKHWSCHKKQRTGTTASPQDPVDPKPASIEPTNKDRFAKHCSFCKRSGHLIDSCYQRQRSEGSGNRKTNEVNFCSGSSQNAMT